MEYVSRVPQPPLDGLIDDLYYLEGTPPYPDVTIPGNRVLHLRYRVRRPSA
ncbi:hypothetical protein ACFHWS_19040 [Micromonospora sp. LOL_013]|uniref:hypothetical protein n=1 Tax=Micromonospora sp. LOL_013 TaxID=3345414 RepID=UPI003A892F8B